jgi:hypothetical protein
VTPFERRLAIAAWRAILPARPGFEDADLAAALDRLLARFPPRGALAFRAAVLATAALRPTFGARDGSSYLAALARHRLAPLRQVAQLLKGALFLGALEGPEARRALGVER